MTFEPSSGARQLICPGCSKGVAEGISICPYCDCIVDDSFLLGNPFAEDPLTDKAVLEPTVIAPPESKSRAKPLKDAPPPLPTSGRNVPSWEEEQTVIRTEREVREEQVRPRSRLAARNQRGSFQQEDFEVTTKPGFDEPSTLKEFEPEDTVEPRTDLELRKNVPSQWLWRGRNLIRALSLSDKVVMVSVLVALLDLMVFGVSAPILLATLAVLASLILRTQHPAYQANPLWPYFAQLSMGAFGTMWSLLSLRMEGSFAGAYFALASFLAILGATVVSLHPKRSFRS